MLRLRKILCLHAWVDLRGAGGGSSPHLSMKLYWMYRWRIENEGEERREKNKPPHFIGERGGG